MEFREGSFRGQAPTLCTFAWPIHDLPSIASEKIPLFHFTINDSLWQDNSHGCWLRNHLMGNELYTAEPELNVQNSTIFKPNVNIQELYFTWQNVSVTCAFVQWQKEVVQIFGEDFSIRGIWFKIWGFCHRRGGGAIAPLQSPSLPLDEPLRTQVKIEEIYHCDFNGVNDVKSLIMRNNLLGHLHP